MNHSPQHITNIIMEDRQNGTSFGLIDSYHDYDYQRSDLGIGFCIEARGLYMRTAVKVVDCRIAKDFLEAWDMLKTLSNKPEYWKEPYFVFGDNFLTGRELMTSSIFSANNFTAALSTPQGRASYHLFFELEGASCQVP